MYPVNYTRLKVCTYIDVALFVNNIEKIIFILGKEMQ